jgi:hypothetical protein
MRIRIQFQIQDFDDQKIKKIYSWKFINNFLIKNLLIPRPPKRTSKLQEKPSTLKREHPALQNMKILYLLFIFCGSYLPSWIRIQRVKLMRIHADPDPQPC